MGGAAQRRSPHASCFPFVLVGVAAPKGLAGVSTFGFTAGSLLITALSKGRGYGAAGSEGLLSSFKISESLTHPACGIPLLPQASEGYCQLVFRRQGKMYKLQGTAEARLKPCPDMIRNTHEFTTLCLVGGRVGQALSRRLTA
jgi:hypothetical protein